MNKYVHEHVCEHALVHVQEHENVNMNIYRTYNSMFMTCKCTKKRHGHLHGKGSGRGRDRGRGHGHGICRFCQTSLFGSRVISRNIAEYNANAGGSSEVRKEKVRRNFGPMEFRRQN